MHKKSALIISLLLPFSTHAYERYVAQSAIPKEIKPFIQPTEKLLQFKEADLNGDGLKDYVIVVEKQKKNKTDDDIEDGQRPLKILVRKADGSLTLAKTNENVVFCATCGGVMGDPFVEVSATKNSFSVLHYGGSAWRWENTYTFNYSRIDNTWQLVLAKDVSFHSSDPKKQEVKIYRPPKDFGKIDLADFDPYTFLKKDAKK